MNDALSLSKNCLVPEDSWRTMQHFSAVLFPKGGHVLLFFVKGIVFVWAAVLAICCILELESLICVLFAALMWCWKIGESEHHPKRHLWPEWIKMTWNRFFKGAQAGLRLLLGVSLVSPWCLQATWKVSQEPFFDSRLIVETSALFIAASFRIRHLDQISGPNGPEVADNLMHMQHHATEHIWNAVVRNMIVSEIHGDIPASVFGFNSVFGTPWNLRVSIQHVNEVSAKLE